MKSDCTACRRHREKGKQLVTSIVSFGAGPEMKSQLIDICMEQGMSLSDLMRDIVSKALAANKAKRTK